MDSPRPQVVYRFGPYELDCAEHALTRAGSPLPLTPRAFETLRVLVEHAGHLVTKDELLKEVWGETFVEESTLTQNIFTLRRALGAEGAQYIETVPTRGYRFTQQVEPLARNGQAPGAAASEPAVIPGGPAMGRRAILWAIPLLLAVAVVTFLAWPRRSVETQPPARIMLAVLPFENLTGDPNQDYLCDGLTEEMISRLSRVESARLGVIARTSSMSYKETKKTAAQIGTELGVQYLLEGSVRRDGDRVRVTAQLIRTADQTHLWAHDFNREFTGVFDLQTEAANAVVAQLLPHFSPPSRITASPAPDAYQAYLRARYHHARGTVSSLEQAIPLYEEAARLDPQFAEAHAGLAQAFIFGTTRRPAEALVRASAEAKQAILLAQNSPEANLALAMTRLYHARDWKGSEEAFRSAIALNPGSAEARYYYSHLLAATGRFDEALAAAQTAEALDPFSTLISHYVGRIHYFARRYDAAEAKLRKTLELDPNYGWAHLFLAGTYYEMGRLDEAVRHRQRYWSVLGESPEKVKSLGDTYAKGSYPAVLHAWRDWIAGFAEERGFVTSAELALVSGHLGRKDDAFRWLDRAFADHTRDLIYLNVEPGFDPLRKDPRFDTRLKQLAFPK